MNGIGYKNGVVTIILPISSLLWFFVLSVMFTLFFVGGPSYYSSPIYKEFWNIGHIIFFSLSTYQLIMFFNKKSFIFIASISFGYGLILGSAIELLQSRMNRSMDLHDLYRDILGTLLALAFFFYQNKKKQNANNIHYQYLLLFILSFVLIAIDQKRLVQAIQVKLQAQNNFPMLADFETSNELKQWSGKNLSLSNKHVLTGLFSMEAKLSAATKFSGFSLKQMPSDWRGFEYLLINIYNPNENIIKICTKISDVDHDLKNQSYNNRFNQCFSLLGNQWNNIKIPLINIENSPKGRKLEMNNMSQLGLFTSGLKSDKIIYLDGITLL